MKTDARSLSVGHGASVPAAGPRSDLWPGVREASESDGHQTGAVSAAFSVATCLRRAVIDTIRRECLDHLIVFNERSLHRHLQAFVDYYHPSRVHLALEKDTPEPRPIQPPESGRIVSIPVLGGLHHRYERRAA